MDVASEGVVAEDGAWSYRPCAACACVGGWGAVLDVCVGDRQTNRGERESEGFVAGRRRDGLAGERAVVSVRASEFDVICGLPGGCLLTGG